MRNALSSTQNETLSEDTSNHQNVVQLFPQSPIKKSKAEMLRERFRQAAAWGSEKGTSTAEYAIATLAAVGFAGLLVVILKSEEVRGFLMNIIRTALSIP